LEGRIIRKVHMKPVILELDFRFWGVLHASRTAFERIDGIDF